MSEELLDNIRLGIKSKDFFFYDDMTITIRALSSFELDKCEREALMEVDSAVSKFILRLRVRDNIDMSSLDDSVFKNLSLYYNKLDYWIVYYAMKDFMPKDFNISDVFKMKYVHEIADKVMKMTSANDNVVIDFVSTPEGSKIATIVYKLHQPLTSNLYELTPLQHKFLVYAHPSAPKKVADSWDEFVKIKMGEVANKVVR